MGPILGPKCSSSFSLSIFLSGPSPESLPRRVGHLRLPAPPPLYQHVVRCGGLPNSVHNLPFFAGGSRTRGGKGQVDGAVNVIARPGLLVVEGLGVESSDELCRLVVVVRNEPYRLIAIRVYYQFYLSCCMRPEATETAAVLLYVRGYEPRIWPFPVPARLFGASRGPRPSADGPGHPQIIHLMQNRLPCIVKTAS